MKVLMINSVCGIRSTGRICTDIAYALEKSGHECKIAYGREMVLKEHKKYAIRIGSDFGVKVHAGLSRIFDRSGFYSKYATKKLILWIEEFNPDIIHLHNLHGYYINIPMLFEYLRKSDKPIVWTLHDCWTFTGHCTYFDYVKCNKWEEQCSQCPQKNRYPKSVVFDNSKRNFTKKRNAFIDIPKLQLVTPSQWLAGLVKKSFLCEYDIHVINNGINTDVFHPIQSDFRKKFHLENKKIVLGIASDWSERKGLIDFIRLSDMLDESFQIVLVGLSESQAAIMPKNIISIEKTNSTKELAEIYSSADAVFNPTYEDNYPTVNLEAQACGTPVVTYKTGGSVESVPNNNVIEKGNIDQFLQKDFAKLEIQANIPSRERMTDKYLELYKSILAD